MRVLWIVAELIALLLGGVLHAQSPADRLALAREADALQSITDVATLPDSLVSAPAPTNLLQDGLRALREGQLAHDRGLLFDALQSFDRARIEEPAWPWPRFGLALAKLALHQDGAISRPSLGGQLAGESYREGFRRSLEETFARDSAFEPGLRFAVAQTAEQRDRVQPAVIARAVEHAAGRWPDDTLAQLALAFVYRTALRYEDGEREFARYAELGGDPGIALLERARSVAGDSVLAEAADLYRSGARDLSDSARARYRHDLTWVATRRELGAFDALPRDSIPAWLTRFWQQRDALALRSPGDRLEEHLRRWAYVYRNFRVDVPDRRSGYVRITSATAGPCSRSVPDSLNEIMMADDASRLSDDRRDEAVLDHRAIIYMRHGAPAWGMPAGPLLADTGVTISMAGPDADRFKLFPPSNLEADQTRRSGLWVYWIQGRARPYYFHAGMGMSELGPLRLSPTLPVGLTPFLAELDPVYKHAAHMYRVHNDGLPHATPLLCSPLVQDMTIQSEKDVQTAVRTDSYTLLFSHQLDALMQVYAVGSAARGTARLLITAAVPAATLDSVGAVRAGKLEWPLHVRVTAVDTMTGRVVRSDTVRTFARRAPIPAGGFLGFTTELPVTAGHYVTHAGVFDSASASGTASAWGNVVVQPSVFSMSDVVLGVEAGGVLWDNRGDPFRVNVSGGYHRNQPAPIYFELYGRTPGREYRTSISVHERGKPNKRGVTLDYTRAASQQNEHVRLTLDLSRLGEGQHELTVTIRDEVTGVEVRTDRVVEIVNP